MSSYFDFRLQRAHILIKAMLPMVLMVLLWLSLMRLSLYFFYYTNQVGFSLSLLEAFFAGARFDLLVLGFAAIPFVFIVWGYALLWSPWKLKWFVKTYIFAVVLISSFFAMLDAVWVGVFRERINHRFEWDWLTQFSTAFEQTSFWVFAGFAMVLLISMIILLKLISAKLEKNWSDFLLMPELIRVPGLRHTLRFVWTLMWVALAARGTLTPHHLNIEHAEISSDTTLNQIPLNPIWNLDK